MEDLLQPDDLMSNSSEYPYYKDIEDFYQLIYMLRLLLMFYYIIIFFVGLTGNGIVIWIAGFKIKTVSAVWFLNLAIADFIFDAFLPFHVSTLIFFQWPYGKFLCKLVFTVQLLNMFASICFLTIISIDRCVSILQPLWAKIHRTHRLASTISVFIWTLSLIISVPNFFFYDVQDDFHWNLSYCDYRDDYHFLKSNLYTNVILYTKTLCMFCIPFAIIIVCNGLIALKMCRVKRKRNYSRPFKVIGAVVICFFICWFPYHFQVFILANLELTSFVTMLLKTLFECLAFSNSCLNPILYLIIGRNYKGNIKKSISSIMESTLSERNHLSSHEGSDAIETNV